MKIGVIGAGEMGSGLAAKFVQLGHEVSISNSRGPDSIRQLADTIGVKPVAIGQVVLNKDVIIIAIPQKNILQLSKDLFKNLSGEVAVIDTGNYYPTLRDGEIKDLDKEGIDSKWVQYLLGISIVKAFNSILATSIRDLARPKGSNARVAIAISGDDLRCKQKTARLIDELGFDAFDVGTIQDSWKQQPGSPIYCRDITFIEMKKRMEFLDRPWSDIREVILTKRRADEALMKMDYAAYLKGLTWSNHS